MCRLFFSAVSACCKASSEPLSGVLEEEIKFVIRNVFQAIIVYLKFLGQKRSNNSQVLDRFFNASNLHRLLAEFLEVFGNHFEERSRNPVSRPFSAAAP